MNAFQACVPVLAVLFAGCPPAEPDLTVTLETADAYDECNICVDVTVTHGAAPAVGAGLRRSVDGSQLDAAGEADEEGFAQVCFYPMKPGEHDILVAVSYQGTDRIGTATIWVCPFGYDLGLDKQGEEWEAAPAPVVDTGADNPVFDVSAGSAWDADRVTNPAVARTADGYLMLYAGGGEEYQIGAAVSDDGVTWDRLDGDPVMEADFAGDWSSDAVNAPALLARDDGLWAWFHGAGAEEIAIGLAHSDDGLDWFSEGPVFEPGAGDQWDHGSVSHPSVVERDGVFEMWYASGTLQIGHALSADGVAWTRYCQNPTFTPQAYDTWEGGAVSRPEVFWLDGTYHMLYTAGGPDSWQVGHAASGDGLRWERSGDEPILPRGGEGEWDELGTSNAFGLVEDDDVTIWYAGQADGPGTVGMASIEGWD